MLLLSLLACAPDYAVKNICVEEGSGFDIEEVSVLQDAAGYPDSRDAVVLHYDTASLGPTDTWRITQIELLAMIPERYFDSYTGGDVLHVDVWNQDHPEGKADWSVGVAIDPATLDWSPLTLPADAYWAGQRGELKQEQAWMPFDFASVIPETGMASGDYSVAVTWASEGLPTIGYSNFNLPCNRNWTDYGDHTWVLNSDDGDKDTCSWPMMRVQVETRTADDGTCEGTSIPM